MSNPTYWNKRQTLRDYQHASRVFVSDNFANAPKFKWLFHCYFEINKNLIADNPQITFPDTLNYGVLVKSVDLPKFTINLQQLNQYNRKRYIQTKIEYDPVRITFHDDNENTIRNLWFSYYSYNFFDPTQPQGAVEANNPNMEYDVSAQLNGRNIYSPVLPEDQLRWGYTGNTNNTAFARTARPQKSSFFRSISVFGFNQHKFSQYQFINPIIDSFSHDTYSYSDSSGTMENMMSLRYESVKYYEGALNGQRPEEVVSKFGGTEYDHQVSPITAPGTNALVMTPQGFRVGGYKSDLAARDQLSRTNSGLRDRENFVNTQRQFNSLLQQLYTPQPQRPGQISNPRSATLIPARGSQNNVQGQVQNSTNPLPTGPQPRSTPGNNPIPVVDPNANVG